MDDLDSQPHLEKPPEHPGQSRTLPEASEPAAPCAESEKLSAVSAPWKRDSLPFYRRCPFTLFSVCLLGVIYALTSYPNGFAQPVREVLALGAFYPPLVQQGEWWRYITATLLHANVSHVFNNTLGLLIFGNMLEPVIGSSRLFWLYVFSAYTGLWLSSKMMPNALTIGASTIDYGLIGAYMALMLLIRLRSDKAQFFRELRGTVLFVIVFITWNTIEGATVNVWGHIGGLLAGVVFALILWMSRGSRAA